MGGPGDVREWLDSVERVSGDRTAFSQLIVLRLPTRITGPEFTAAVLEAIAHLKSRGLSRSVLVVHSQIVAGVLCDGPAASGEPRWSSLWVSPPGDLGVPFGPRAVRPTEPVADVVPAGPAAQAEQP